MQTVDARARRRRRGQINESDVHATKVTFAAGFVGVVGCATPVRYFAIDEPNNATQRHRVQKEHMI